MIYQLLLLRVLVFLALLGSCSAQECSSAVVPVNVFSKNGMIVQGVELDRIVVRVHGEPANITSFNRDTAPRRVVLLLDISGSMVAYWQIVQRLGMYAVHTIPSNASIAVGTIGRRPYVSGFDTHAQAESQIQMLTPKWFSGETPLFDSIHQALAILDRPHFGDVIYLITDGAENHSKADEDRIQNELAQHGTRIFVLLVPHDFPRTQEEQDAPQVMGKLVKQTGGHLTTFPPSPDRKQRAELLQAGTVIQSQIASSYRMVVSLAEPIKKSASLDVRYAVADKNLAKSLRWVYPLLIGCAPGR